MVRKLLAGSGSVRPSFEKRYLASGGGGVWANINVAVQRGPDGVPLYFIATIENITQRKQAKEALRQSETRFRSLFESMHEGFAHCRMLLDEGKPVDFVYLSVNDAFGRLTGLTDVEGKKVSEVIPGIRESNADLLETYRRVATTGRPERLETFIEPLGIWFSISVYSPEREHFVAVFDNITERKRQEEYLSVLNQRLEQLEVISRQLSQARSMETITGLVTRAARKITGADGAIFVLREGDECVCADEDGVAPAKKGERFPIGSVLSGWVIRNGQAAVIEDVLEDERTAHAVYRSTFVRSVAMVPIRAADPIGAIGLYWARTRTADQGEVQFLAALADTAAVALENVRLYEDLDSRVKERTRELETANRELEAFSYSVSHDLRAPLRAIDGFASRVSERYGDRLEQEGQRLLGVVRKNAKRMAKLIDDLLTFTRLGRGPMRCSLVAMRPVVEAALKEIATESPLAGRVAVDVQDLPEAWGDAALLHQVWSNLLSNALKFSSPREKPEIRVDGRVDGEDAVYRVRDNGVGFDMAYADKLFGVFERLHRNGEFDGTGVGLALVHRIVTRHGGRVWAEGAVGQGASFSFSLPRQRGRIVLSQSGSHVPLRAESRSL